MITTSIGIIGYGRFGRILKDLFAEDYAIFFYDSDERLQQEPNFKAFNEIIQLLPTQLQTKEVPI